MENDELEQSESSLDYVSASEELLEFNEKEQDFVDEFQMLTSKPVLYVCNVDEAAAKDGNDYVAKVRSGDELVKYSDEMLTTLS